MSGTSRSGRHRVPREKLELTGQLQFSPQRYKDRTDSSIIAFPETTTYIEPTVKLSKRTRQAWDITIPCLLKMRILTPLDFPMLEKAFESLEECNKAAKALKDFDKRTKEEGLDVWENIRERKQIKSWYRESLDTCISIFSRYGLTPSDRAKLDLSPSLDDTKEKDPLDIVLEG